MKDDITDSTVITRQPITSSDTYNVIIINVNASFVVIVMLMISYLSSLYLNKN